MSFIDDFKSAVGDGQRTYMFEWLPPIGAESQVVTLLFADALVDPSRRFTAKSLSCPEISTGEASVFYQGMEMKVGTSKRTSDWNVTFYYSSNFNLRGRYEAWSQLVHTTIPDYQRYGRPGDYLAHQVFKLTDVKGDISSLYCLLYCWPKIIGPVNMDVGTQDIATFDVTYSYMYSVSDMGLISIF